jgi:hypothetical protein
MNYTGPNAAIVVELTCLPLCRLAARPKSSGL